jgi:hypothetical protein|tara:strand:- start:1061 stop:1351 length:291 start_codon:yes stop_codon:yes gene_type:complete
MKDKLVQVKLSEVESAMLERLCEFFQKTKSQMLRDLIFVEHVEWQTTFDKYDNFIAWSEENGLGYEPKIIKTKEEREEFLNKAKEESITFTYDESR